MANRLIHELSPYLLQHAHNPVDWHPWDGEALQKAKREQKPIFLSIGYSACHWCHVMERESFEDPETAKLLNQWFVCIKVDREERQDLDHIYMGAVQMMTGHGGWPMSVFLTPDLAPFYGGTYFPPEDRHGMPSFKRVLTGVSHAWQSKRPELLQTASQLIAALEQMHSAPGRKTTGSALTWEKVDQAVARYHSLFDNINGGIGGAPKFFHTGDLRLLLRHWWRHESQDSLSKVALSLTRMANGGIFDQLGGGFHRYSTDAEWHVPHFEKMLYDNALLSQLYLEAFQATQDPLYATTAHNTFAWLLREMTDPRGFFYATQDADTEGEEGKYFVWSQTELEEILGPDLCALFSAAYSCSPEGNWEGSNILVRRTSLTELSRRFAMETEMVESSLETARRKLLARRQERVAPAIDRKAVTAWNGMMIESLANASAVLSTPPYLEAAVHAAEFLWNEVWEEKSQTLRHVFQERIARLAGFLDDYAAATNAFLTLFEHTGDPKWFERANRLGDSMCRDFWEEKTGSFYYSSDSEDKLLVRPRENSDGAMPSATGQALFALARLSHWKGDHATKQKVITCLENCGDLIQQSTTGSTQLLLVIDFLLSPPTEIVCVHDSDGQFREAASQHFLPHKIGVYFSDQVPLAVTELPLLKGKNVPAKVTTGFLCENFHCSQPTENLNEWREQLSSHKKNGKRI